MTYEEEKAIETAMEAEIQAIVDSNKMWYPHNMAFACRSALQRAGFEITKSKGQQSCASSQR